MWSRAGLPCCIRGTGHHSSLALGRTAGACPGTVLHLEGEAVGGRSDPQQGRTFLLLGGCCVGQGCSELQINPRTFLRVVFMNVVDAAIPIKTKSFPEFVL